ncbi:MAG: hypothetical protein K8F90_09465 [Hyphomicrobiales bacterium]|nr:hypothetical protein [Hyphomicrobiales bacterium]
MQHGENTASFVARIWLERLTNGDVAWRGHVQHIQSGEELRFRKIFEMRHFLERQSGVTCDGLWKGDGEDLKLSG